MKKITLFMIMSLFCICCEKNKFDLDNPDVGIFVHDLKYGSYASYEKGTNGDNLWLLMPKFTKNHIQALLDFSSDTTHIQDFPINPISSRRPFPEGRNYFILGECLLWTVEGIRNSSGYGSLDPFLVDVSNPDPGKYKGLNCNEILEVRDLYIKWWNNFKGSDWKAINPLKDSSCHWF